MLFNLSQRHDTTLHSTNTPVTPLPRVANFLTMRGPISLKTLLFYYCYFTVLSEPECC